MNDFNLKKFMEKNDLNNLNENLVKWIILEMSRTFDKDITKLIKNFSKAVGTKFNSNEKNEMRLMFYYKDFLEISDKYNLKNFYNFLIANKTLKKYSIKTELEENGKKIQEKINKSLSYKAKILGTMKSRHNEILAGKIFKNGEIEKKIQNFINNYEKNKYQFSLLRLNSSGNEDTDFKKIISLILEVYDNLVNYHYLAIIFEDNIQSKFTWKVISRIAIFCENMFKEKKFSPFNSNSSKKKKELNEFLEKNNFINYNENLKKVVENFYSAVYYGFNFSDFFISEDGNKKILLLQKIELDETPLPCIDCGLTVGRGNSFPKILMKSFECSNPNCKSRSKSGRGKRYNYLSSKLQLMKKKCYFENKISEDVYKNFRRDIFSNNVDILKTLINLYSFKKDRILIYDKNFNFLNNNYLDREITELNLTENSNIKFCEIPIINLLKNVYEKIKKPSDDIIWNFIPEVIHGDSRSVLRNIPENYFKYAVTSPPYYNAREYSQWKTFVCYLIDMMIISSYTFQKMENKGYFLYNIADIVDKDNVYVSSNMSNKRIMLGFYTIAIFEISGYKTSGNIIWDKGEVQSKRNSTSDLFPFYVKPINCYEHIFIFEKNEKTKKNITFIEKFTPVFKIIKGKNIIQHSAPFPEKLVSLIENFTTDKKRILDPFLGSGTTVFYCKKKSQKVIGIEQNDEYYNLILKKLKELNLLNKNKIMSKDDISAAWQNSGGALDSLGNPTGNAKCPYKNCKINSYMNANSYGNSSSSDWIIYHKFSLVNGNSNDHSNSYLQAMHNECNSMQLKSGYEKTKQA